MSAPLHEEQNSAVLEHIPDIDVQQPSNKVLGLEKVAAVQDQQYVHIPEIPSVWIYVRQDVHPSTIPQDTAGCTSPGANRPATVACKPPKKSDIECQMVWDWRQSTQIFLWIKMKNVMMSPIVGTSLKRKKG